MTRPVMHARRTREPARHRPKHRKHTPPAAAGRLPAVTPQRLQIIQNLVKFGPELIN